MCIRCDFYWRHSHMHPAYYILNCLTGTDNWDIELHVYVTTVHVKSFVNPKICELLCSRGAETFATLNFVNATALKG